ncbi:MAG: hypothetical protein QXP36_15260 [Conexivisphaerales archaeon]
MKELVETSTWAKISKMYSIFTTQLSKRRSNSYRAIRKDCLMVSINDQKKRKLTISRYYWRADVGDKHL